MFNARNLYLNESECSNDFYILCPVGDHGSLQYPVFCYYQQMFVPTDMAII